MCWAIIDRTYINFDRVNYIYFDNTDQPTAYIYFTNQEEPLEFSHEDQEVLLGWFKKILEKER